jgi:hypothetical protein
LISAALTDLTDALLKQGAVGDSEWYIDSKFTSAKGGGEQIGPTRRGKDVRVKATVDRHRLPLAVTTQAANHH